MIVFYDMLITSILVGDNMLLNLNKQAVNYLENMCQEKMIDTALQMAITVPLQSGNLIFEDKYILERDAMNFQKHMRKQGFDFNYEQSIMAIMILEVLKNFPMKKWIPEPVIFELIKESKLYKKEELLSNPYMQNIHFEEDRAIGDYRITIEHQPRYSLFFYDIPQREFMGARLPKIGSVNHRYDYPCIGATNDDAWMSITPNEFTTMEHNIEESYGNVLTLGCGMGYYAYMVSEKSNVKSVSIVEKEPQIIELFNSYILPQFNNKDKVKIVQADAFEFMNSLDDNVYDYCFADIWKNNLDSLSYMKLRSICKKFKDMKISYWIEGAILSGLKSYLMSELLAKHNSVLSHSILSEEDRKASDYLLALYKDRTIETIEDIEALGNYDDIINTISNV